MANEQRQRMREYFAPVGWRAWRACAGKVRFPSRKNARARARALAAGDGDPRWNHYRCPACRSWHVGHA